MFSVAQFSKGFALVALFTFSVPALFSQVITGTILGAVADPTGQSVAHAAVTVRNVETNVKNNSSTSESGDFVVPLLQTGIYEVEISAPGFKTFRQTGIHLDVDSKFRVDARLQLGATREAIEVVSKFQVLQTDSSDLNSQISRNMVEDLPNVGRNPMLYALNAPGVVGREGFDDPSLLATDDTSRSRMTNFSVNGSRPISSEVTLDGAPNTTTSFNEVAVVPNLDSIGEIKVTTNAYSAEFGRSAGGVVSFGTKSGQNAVHGSLYEYFQNSVLNATGFQNNSYGRKPDGSMVKPKATFNTNKFGGTVSGPVVLPHYNGHNKTFFFFSYEGNQRATGNSPMTTVPTALERVGDFSQSWNVVNGVAVPRQVFIPVPDTTTIVTSPTDATKYRLDRMQACDPWPCGPNSTMNKIPAQFLSKAAMKLASYYPLPNLPGDQNGSTNYFSSNSDKTATNQFSVKLDQIVSQRQRVFVRYIQDSTSYVPANLFKATAPEVGPAQPSLQWNPSGTVGYTIAVSQTSIIDLRANVTRINQSLAPGSGAYDFSQLGFSTAMSGLAPNPVFPTININGFQGFGIGGYQFRDNHSTNGSANGSYTKILSQWTLKAGGEYRTYLANFNQQMPASMAFSAPNTKFSQQCTAYGLACAAQPQVNGSNFADFLMGAMDGAAAGGQFTSGGPRLALKNSFYGFYSENDWKVTHKLTLNLGVRWDTSPPVTERYNRLSQFDPTGKNYTGTAGVMEFAGVNGNTRNQQNTDWTNIAPRIGAAFRLNEKTVIRSAYGIFYDITTGFGAGSQRFGVNGFDAPAFATIRPMTGVAANADILQNQFNQASVTGGSIIGPNPNDPRYLARDIDAIVGRMQKTPYVQQWNFTVQRELGAGIMLQVAYAGSKGTRLILGSLALNAITAIPPDVLNNARSTYISTGVNPMNDMVPNPFYGVLTSGSSRFLGPTIPRNQLYLAYPAFQNVTEFQNRSGSSSYNALQVQVRRAFHGGVEFTGNYTFSKNIDFGNHISVTNYNTSNGVGQGSFNFGQYNENLNRSLSTSDSPHVASAYYTVNLPFGKGRHFIKAVPLLSYAVGGWKVGGITTLRSGFPLSITSNAGFGRPDLVEDPILPQKYQAVGDGVTPLPLPDGTTVIVPNGRRLLFNPHAFQNRTMEVANPAPSSKNPYATQLVDDIYWYGTSPRYMSGLRGFGMVNTDLSLMRVFQIGEGKSVTFKADASNVFNRTDYSDGSIQKGMGNSVTNQTFADKSGLWADPKNLTATQRATLGYSSDNSFGTLVQNPGLSHSPRYMSLALHIRF